MRAVRARFAVAMIAAAALGWSLGSWDVRAEVPELALENPSPGVYIHYGQQAEMAPENFGDIANVGFVVGATAGSLGLVAGCAVSDAANAAALASSARAPEVAAAARPAWTAEAAG